MAGRDDAVRERRLIAPPAGQGYTSFLSELCRKRRASRYLEIGVQAGTNLSQINVKDAIGVDPAFALTTDPTIGKQSLALYRMTSDDYFARHRLSGLDLAFLDGLHRFEFLLRDFMNAEKASRTTAVIAMHDCLPFDASMITREDNHGAWTGDVYKVVMILERHRPDLKLHLADCHPTGLVCVSNLDPTSTVLKTRYDQIVRDFSDIPADLDGLLDFYEGRAIHPAGVVMDELGRPPRRTRGPIASLVASLFG